MVWVFSNLCNSTILYRDHFVISSRLFLNDLSRLLDTTTQCPSLQNLLPYSGFDSSDWVLAIHYKSWPTIANEWLFRNREFSWPNQTLIEINKMIGCYFVSIGCPFSSIPDLQWRISFVLSEKCLVRSFNSVQFKVYGLLKIIKSELLSNYTCEDCGENLINSYHMKTIMMWVSENVPETLWIPKRLVLCLRICLRYLKHFVNIGYLPDYFLPNRNLLIKHANSEKEGLIRYFDNLITNPLVIFRSLDSLQDSIFLYYFDCDKNTLDGSQEFQRLLDNIKKNRNGSTPRYCAIKIIITKH